jgi:hypothetical protein
MMKWIPLTGVTLAVLSAATTVTLAQQRTITGAARFSYAAKFICGEGSEEGALVRGQYRTKVNVHNALPGPSQTLEIKKKAVILRPEGSERESRVSEIHTDQIEADRGFSVPCEVIRELFDPKATGDLIEGYVVIHSPHDRDVLDVTTVITVGSLDGGGIRDIEIEDVEAKEVAPPPP